MAAMCGWWLCPEPAARPGIQHIDGRTFGGCPCHADVPRPHVNDARTASNRFDMIGFRADFKLWACVLLRRMRESAEGSGLGQQCYPLRLHHSGLQKLRQRRPSDRLDRSGTICSAGAGTIGRRRPPRPVLFVGRMRRPTCDHKPDLANAAEQIRPSRGDQREPELEGRVRRSADRTLFHCPDLRRDITSGRRRFRESSVSEPRHQINAC
jgi:hypothetical protein